MMKRFKLLALAALLVLPLAACDEGAVVAPAVTGSVSGTVTVDGTGAAGVRVTLSNGSTATTSATGTYTISDVAAGPYTVTISGFPADAAFPSTTQAVVVATAGQVVTVNFAGSRVRTSAIFGSVTSGGGPLAGVTVTLSGTESKTTTTDANGQFALSGLRAGAYTVTISGMPASVTCPTVAQAVTVAAGESKVSAFACTPNSTGRISGIMFYDENNKNKLFDGAALEDPVRAANVAITLEGPTVGVTRTVQTDAAGAYTFTALAAGTYNVKIDAADLDIPAGAVYGGVSPTFTVAIAAGGTATVNFPFDITRQTIRVSAFLGRDVSPVPAGISTTIPTGVAPLSGVILDLYPTAVDAAAFTNRLGRDTTDATGETQFNFLRTADTSPGGAVQDQIVFAQYVSGPNAEHVLNGEDRIEIRYNPRTATGLAADTFDLLNTRTTFAFDAVGSSGTALAGWNTALWLNDTSNVAAATGVTNAAGRQVFTDAVAVGLLPDTFYMRLSGTQAAAGTHAFDQTPVAQRGTAVQKYLRWIHNGVTARTDTVDVGDERVTFSDADLFVRVYHEQDDSIPGGPPRYSGGDNIENADNIEFSLNWRAPSATVDSTRTVTAAAADGSFTFLNVPVAQGPYRVTARSLVTGQVVLNDTTVRVGNGTGGVNDLSGGVLTTRACPLGVNTAAGCATFAFKYRNASVTGRVKAADSTAAAGIIVRLAPTAQNIQGTATFSDTTDANGLFGFADLREGPYTLTAAGNATWGVVSTNPFVLDLQGNADNDILNFIVRRLDTSISGVVVNDRDGDNVIDVGDALAGVILQLYRSNANTSTAAITLDTLAATTTTNANGAYTFSNLPEARYIVKVLQPGTAVVTRGVNSLTGAHWDTTVVRTAATTVGAGANLTRTVGTTTPANLPYWNYSNNSVAFNDRTHYSFVYNNTRATGVITLAAGGAPVAGMTVAIRRCLTSAGAVKPPAAGACTAYFPNSVPITATTDATGTFNFLNLQEGVWEVTPSPATAGLTAVAPVQRLFLQIGNQNIERGDFLAS